MKIQRFRDDKGNIGFCEMEASGGRSLLKGDLLKGFQSTNQRIEISEILSPVEPPIVFCIGLNYARHAEEAGVSMPERPVVFVKTPNTIQDPDAPILLPRAAGSKQVDYEAELAVVIGKPCRNVAVKEAMSHIAGYTCANDVSARDWQLQWGGGQWCRGKCFDTFCPLGPSLVTPESIPDPQVLAIRSVVNGETKQDWNTSDMIFTVAEIVSFLSEDTTIPAGAVILTGTPHGVGMAQSPPLWLKEGDLVEIEIEGIGRLRNPVRAGNSLASEVL